MTYKPQRYFTMIRDHENKLTTDKKYFEKQRKFKNYKKNVYAKCNE